MQSNDLFNLAQAIKEYLENISQSGLVNLTDETIRQLEMFFQKSSSLKSYRLATSLKYLINQQKVEE